MRRYGTTNSLVANHLKRVKPHSDGTLSPNNDHQLGGERAWTGGTNEPDC